VAVEGIGRRGRPISRHLLRKRGARMLPALVPQWGPRRSEERAGRGKDSGGSRERALFRKLRLPVPIMALVHGDFLSIGLFSVQTAPTPPARIPTASAHLRTFPLGGWCRTEPAGVCGDRRLEREGQTATTSSLLFQCWAKPSASNQTAWKQLTNGAAQILLQRQPEAIAVQGDQRLRQKGQWLALGRFERSLPSRRRPAAATPVRRVLSEAWERVLMLVPLRYLPMAAAGPAVPFASKVGPLTLGHHGCPHQRQRGRHPWSASRAAGLGVGADRGSAPLLNARPDQIGRSWCCAKIRMRLKFLLDVGLDLPRLDRRRCTLSEHGCEPGAFAWPPRSWRRPPGVLSALELNQIESGTSADNGPPARHLPVSKLRGPWAKHPDRVEHDEDRSALHETTLVEHRRGPAVQWAGTSCLRVRCRTCGGGKDSIPVPISAVGARSPHSGSAGNAGSASSPGSSAAAEQPSGPRSRHSPRFVCCMHRRQRQRRTPLGDEAAAPGPETSSAQGALPSGLRAYARSSRSTR